MQHVACAEKDLKQPLISCKDAGLWRAAELNTLENPNLQQTTYILQNPMLSPASSEQLNPDY